jgi:integrase
VRVSDIMQRGYIIRREQKTGKQTEIRFSPKILADLRRLLSTRRGDELIFKSPYLQHRGEPIDRMTAYRWIVTACRNAGMTEPVGCHTLRKTYGYHFYQKYRDVAMLMEIFNHASESITMRYIGVTQEQINSKRQSFYL